MLAHRTSPSPETPRDTIAARYLTSTFAATDWIAIVALHRPTTRVIQRLARVATIVTPRWQAWLRFLNAHAYEIYASVNTFHAHARSRTKPQLAAIRHLFLDVDAHLDAVRRRLREAHIPAPHHVIHSSADRGQLLWCVRDCTVADVEAYQRRWADAFGADPAATDATRVGRLPGFRSHKYTPAWPVTIDSVTTLTPFRLGDFPPIDSGSIIGRPDEPRRRGTSSGRSSPSERDWSWVLQQLGASRPVAAIEALLVARRPDKRHPEDYAARTVDAAWTELALRTGADPQRLVVELIARRRARPHVDEYARHIVARAVLRSNRLPATGGVTSNREATS